MDLLTWFWAKGFGSEKCSVCDHRGVLCCGGGGGTHGDLHSRGGAEGYGRRPRPEGLSAPSFLPELDSEFTEGRGSRPFLAGVVSGRTCLRMGQGWPQFWAIPLLVTLALLNGVRGTFAYHKLPPRPEGLPSLAQSLGRWSETLPEGEKIAGKAKMENRRRLASRQANDVGRSDGEGVAAGAGGRRGGG